MITFYGVPGTWALFDAGFQADVARELPGVGEWDILQCELFGEEVPFRWQGVNYPASFGPVNPPPWAPVPAPSYADSVLVGAAELTRLINATPGKFVISGYSQGGGVVGLVRQALVAGNLHHRVDDCLLSITFGDPTRQPSDEVYGGGAGAGISRLEIPPCPFRCVTYAVTGDMYCTTPTSTQAGDDMHAVYEALTSLGGNLSVTDLLTEVMDTLASPIMGGVAAVEAIIRALKVGAHGTYGPWVDHAANIVRALAA